MKLNDAIMKETFSKFDEENDPILYRVYGVVTASAVKRLLLESLSAFSNQYFLVGFSKMRLIMIRIDMLGKPKEPIVIHFLDIQNAKISSWMFGMGKEIFIQLTDGSKIRLKVNRTNTMLKKQKENLQAICNLLSSSSLGEH